jgi:acyl-CoA reductase-like NAD-dependent aldehyde dehydrogenase
VPGACSLTAHVASYKVGDPSQAGTFIGPLAVASTKQLLQEQVAAALEHGAVMLLPTDATRAAGGQLRAITRLGRLQLCAVCLCIGPFVTYCWALARVVSACHGLTDRHDPGCIAAALGHPGIFPPTVLLSTSFPEVLLQQESFGPLLLVQPVPDEQAALQGMAASHHGLTAAVFSREQQLAQHMLGSLDVGTGFWNQCGEMDFRLPWSGRRASGSGCTLGLQGLHVMLRPKSYNMVGCDS